MSRKRCLLKMAIWWKPNSSVWRQPVVSVAVVTPVRTAKRQSDRVSVVTADFCYFCLLSSYSGWKLSEPKRRLILDKSSSVRTLSHIPLKRHSCILMNHDLWPRHSTVARSGIISPLSLYTLLRIQYWILREEACLWSCWDAIAQSPPLLGLWFPLWLETSILKAFIVKLIWKFS